MGRMSASEYYNDNLRRLLHEEVGRSNSPDRRGAYDGQAYPTDVRREGNPRQGNYRPVRTTYQTDDPYRRDSRTASRPQVPMYGSDSYRIGERDERRGKIDGVYGRREIDGSSYDRGDSHAPAGSTRAGYMPTDRPRTAAQSQPSHQRQAQYSPTRQPQPQRTMPWQPGQPTRPVRSSAAADRTMGDYAQYAPSTAHQVQGQAVPQSQRPSQRSAQPQSQRPVQSQPSRPAQPQPQRPAPRPRPERMQTNPGGGMSYDARYGGEIKPTSAAADAQQDAPANMSRREKAAARKAARDEKKRLDPEAEAEVRENRRLYKEYIDNERLTMDRAERDRRRMEEYYAARSGKFARKLREFFILTAAFAVTLGLICVIVYKFLFVVSEVKVYGESIVDAESVIAASGVENGDNLYSFGASAVSAAVTLRYPIIKSVTVKRTIPNKVAFTVTDDKPVFYSDIYGEFRMLSADLRVMGVKDNSHEGLIKLKLPPLEYAVDGRGVQYSGGKQNKYVMDIIGTLLTSPLAERMTMVDLTHSYDVKMVCDGKYLLNFGESEEMDIKMKLAAAVLEDDLFSGGNKATVDLSDTSQTSVIVDNQLVLD